MVRGGEGRSATDAIVMLHQSGSGISGEVGEARANDGMSLTGAESTRGVQGACGM